MRTRICIIALGLLFVMSACAQSKHVSTSSSVSTENGVKKETKNTVIKKEDGTIVKVNTVTINGKEKVTNVTIDKSSKENKNVGMVVSSNGKTTIVTELPRLSAEEMPEFPGGNTAMMAYLMESVHYPKDAQESQKEGRVICSFVVTKEGKINDAHVVKSSGTESLDTEALRVINAMPDWKPGTEDGEPVNVHFTLPVTFKLQ
ncbi:MAG: energy transducer TonB [Paludibacteraceae bacterium]|nr:energy transducer TonB [Paludibacteraceae bacterium]